MDPLYMPEPLRINRGRERTPGHPLRLLSLDGGGVRGFSTLLMIQQLMLKLFVELHGRAPRVEEIPRPCDHFDLIGGTGTGGLIAIMLGRLRLDLETAKTVYTRFSRKVFETDKTIGGLPYKKTLFKSSKLEAAIKDCVAEVTGSDKQLQSQGFRRRGTVDSSASNGGSSFSRHSNNSREWGDENALLYDDRPDRCRTFVTAVYKGSDETLSPAILRTYDSSRSAPSSPNCTIWEAGRATCAHSPAFKEICIGNDLFLDEGPGRYSPVAEVLEEAVVHLRAEVGVIVSIGSGKRPASSIGTTSEKKGARLLHSTRLGKFVDAKEKHVQKMDDCEAIHQELLSGIQRTGVHPDNYFRFNVEVGIGDYGINEWSKIAEISTSTRRYLGTTEVELMNQVAAQKLAAIERQKSSLTAFGPVDYAPRPAPDTNRELPPLPPEADVESQISDYGSLSDPGQVRDDIDEEISRYYQELDTIKRRILHV